MNSETNTGIQKETSSGPNHTLLTQIIDHRDIGVVVP